MTMGARSRKGILFTFAVAAAVLTTASAAFACVKFKGDLQVTVPAAPSTALGVGTGSRVTGDGSPALHAYCPNPTLSRSGVGYAGEPLFAPDVVASGSITVQVWPASDCNTLGGNQLDAGTNKVYLFNGPGFKGTDGLGWNFVVGTGCFLQGKTSLGTISVSPSGAAGPASYSLSGKGFTTNGPNEASTVCVGNDVTGNGIFAPVQVTLI